MSYECSGVGTSAAQAGNVVTLVLLFLKPRSGQGGVGGTTKAKWREKLQVHSMKTRET